MSPGDATLTALCSEVRDFIREPRPAAFEPLALELFAWQFRQNPAYRAFCERSGRTPDSVRSWTDIPALPTSAFKELELTTIAPTNRVAVFHSSGTTQHRPSRHYHSKETLELYEDSLCAWFKPHVLPDCPRAEFLVLTPRAEQVPHSSLAHMFETVTQKFGTAESRHVGLPSSDGSWTVDFSGIKPTVQPVVICGTAFSFVHWCDFLQAQNTRLSFPAGSRVFETGGYKGRSREISKAELHVLIADRLGIPQTHIITEYGMSELSSQAYDRTVAEDGPRTFHFPPWARVHVISPETLAPVKDGETGLLRVYDLANAGSVLAIQTEDLAVRRGHGFELLGRAAFAEPRGCSLLELKS